MFFLVLMNRINVTEAQTSADFETNSISTNTLVALSFINENEGWVTDETGILSHTSDAGATWSVVATGYHFLKLNFTDPLTGFAMTAEAAYKTTNGGSTWSQLIVPGSVGTTLYFLDSNTGFISGEEEIYKTANGGAIWSTISTEGVSFVDIYFTSSTVGIAAAYDDQYQSLWRTTNGGESWTNVFSQEKIFFNTVWFTDESTGFAAGYYSNAGSGKFPVIFRSVDGGLTWQKVYRNNQPGNFKGQELIDIRFKNELQGIALASYSENAITNDGGLTWLLTYNDEEDIIPSYGIYKTLGGVGELYIAGKRGYITKWK
jgi:photosystem II stability/assembly factor-like uncharacterized protein